MRFPDFFNHAARWLLGRQSLRSAAKHFSARAALTVFCFFALAVAGVGQMDAALRKSIIKEGRYSAVATDAREWLAPDLRIGWKQRDAYVAFADYAALEATSLGGLAISILTLLTPLAWAAAGLVRQSEAKEAAGRDSRPEAAIDEAQWLLDPPVAEG